VCLGDAFECELLGISDKFKKGGKQSCLLRSPTCSSCCLSVSKPASKQASKLSVCLLCARNGSPAAAAHHLEVDGTYKFFFFFRFEIVA
jgi:hypothetical protein